MRLGIRIKQLGKKRNYIDKRFIDIEGEYNTPYPLELIIKNVVSQQVQAFNRGKNEKSLIHFLNERPARAHHGNGRIIFNHPYNSKLVDEEKAIKTALLAFQDGIIAIFMDENQIHAIDEKIIITENSLMTFVKLTFLAGSIW